MTKQTVRWTQQAEVVATVDISLDKLAVWAAESAQVRALTDAEATAAHVSRVRLLLESNAHVRDTLVRLWAVSKATENG